MDLVSLINEAEHHIIPLEKNATRFERVGIRNSKSIKGNTVQFRKTVNQTCDQRYPNGNYTMDEQRSTFALWPSSTRRPAGAASSGRPVSASSAASSAPASEPPRPRHFPPPAPQPPLRHTEREQTFSNRKGTGTPSAHLNHLTTHASRFGVQSGDAHLESQARQQSACFLQTFSSVCPCLKRSIFLNFFHTNVLDKQL